MNKGVWAVLVLVIVGVVAAIVIRKQQSEAGGPGDKGTAMMQSGSTTGPTTQASGDTSRTLTIAVIPKGTTHAHWKAVEAGAEQAGKEMNVNIIFKGPVQEDDRAGQITLVQQFVSDNVDGIVLAPLDDQALLPSAQAAMQKKIPVVIIDSSLKGEVGKDFVCYVGTDNTAAGKMGGTELARVLGGKGKYILLRYAVGSASTEQREDGFLSAMAENPGMISLVNDRYGGATVDQAEAVCMNMLAQIRQADGIFTPNESTTLGMLNTLEENNLAGKIRFVGFDITGQLIDALKKGEVDGLISQNPRVMGYQAVKACVDYIHGIPQQPVQDSGEVLITRDNLNTPEIQKLLAGRL
jgi:ribose transport system substrate-binding protein